MEGSSFDRMGLSDDLLRGIYGYGYAKPSPIQHIAIKPMLSGRDVIAQAQSGTGKTAAFGIPALQRVDTSLDHVQVLILSPVRELAEQTFRVVRSIGSYVAGLRTHLSVAGPSRREEKTAMAKNRPHIVVGTPGRVQDMVSGGVLDVSQLALLVLDEADIMLAEGFLDTVKFIFHEGRMPESMQVAVFSATMSEETRSITSKFTKASLTIIVPPEKLSLKGIKQFNVKTPDSFKFLTLCDLYGTLSVTQAIVYCSSKARVEDLSRAMLKANFPVTAMHGGMTISERNDILLAFRAGTSRVLVCTDLLARGIDIQSLSLVINFDLPAMEENYLHRVGRTGRHGRKGLAINFVSPAEERMMEAITSHYKIDLPPLPDPKELAALL